MCVKSKLVFSSPQPFFIVTLQKRKNRELQEVNLTFKGGLKEKRQMQVTDAIMMVM